jgi:hypothetical protein
MFLQKLKEFLFGKPQLPTFENGIPASGAYSGMPKVKAETSPATALSKAEDQDVINKQLAAAALQTPVVQQTIANKSQAAEQAAEAKVAKIKTRKPRAKKAA